MKIHGPFTRPCCGCNPNSKCLKMYCSCFKNGKLCVACNCDQCTNHEESDQLNQARKSAERKHHRDIGTPPPVCNCRKGCSKNYCVCRKHGRVCTSACRCCDNCTNTKTRRYKPYGRVIVTSEEILAPGAPRKSGGGLVHESAHDITPTELFPPHGDAPGAPRKSGGGLVHESSHDITPTELFPPHGDTPTKSTSEEILAPGAPRKSAGGLVHDELFPHGTHYSHVSNVLFI
jgi:hypothetical protein